MKRNVYFIQPNLSYGSAYYLPYATGCLAAYAWQFEEIKSNYTLKKFIFKRESIEQTMNEISEPDVVAFSCYTWTFEYNKLLAEEIKSKYPNCLVVFGGHHISRENTDFSALPFTDVLIYGEGERIFKQILEHRANGKDFGNIPNIAYRTSKSIIKTKEEYFSSLDGYLSPYLEGYFEDIVAQNPEVEFCAVVETNRGCPYNCAYCDWCYTVDIRKFPIEKIEKELVWCSKNKIEYIFCADSNFGILKRDYEIAEYVTGLRKQYGYPHIFNTCFAKNSNETVFKISKLFYDNKMNKAATLAYQTVCDKALENVNRKNFTMESFAHLVQKYNENNIPTYTEMILGLPGETYDSFCDGLCKLIEAGQQTALTVYYCQVYPNALMGQKAYREKFGIKTARVPLNYLHSSMPSQEDITEYTELVVATNDMPFEDMMRSIMFCTCLQCFHHIGLLKYFAIYVRNELQIKYRDFYSELLKFIYSDSGTFINKLFTDIKKSCSDFSNGEWSYYKEKFGKIGWFLEEGAFLEIVSNYETFWEEIMPFLKKFDIEENVFDELVKYQKFVVRLPYQEHLSEEFVYDFYTYFHKAVSASYEKLEKKKNKIDVIIPNPVYNWEDYARKVVLFAKRRGDTVVVNDKKYLNITYM